MRSVCVDLTHSGHLMVLSPGIILIDTERVDPKIPGEVIAFGICKRYFLLKLTSTAPSLSKAPVAAQGLCCGTVKDTWSSVLDMRRPGPVGLYDLGGSYFLRG